MYPLENQPLYCLKLNLKNFDGYEIIFMLNIFIQICMELFSSWRAILYQKTTFSLEKPMISGSLHLPSESVGFKLWLPAGS